MWSFRTFWNRIRSYHSTAWRRWYLRRLTTSALSTGWRRLKRRFLAISWLSISIWHLYLIVLNSQSANETIRSTWQYLYDDDVMLGSKCRVSDWLCMDGFDWPIFKCCCFDFQFRSLELSLFFCISIGTVRTFIIKGQHGLKGDQRRKRMIFFII